MAQYEHVSMYTCEVGGVATVAATQAATVAKHHFNSSVSSVSLFVYLAASPVPYAKSPL